MIQFVSVFYMLLVSLLIWVVQVDSESTVRGAHNMYEIVLVFYIFVFGVDVGLYQATLKQAKYFDINILLVVLYMFMESLYIMTRLVEAVKRNVEFRFRFVKFLESDFFRNAAKYTTTKVEVSKNLENGVLYVNSPEDLIVYNDSLKNYKAMKENRNFICIHGFAFSWLGFTHKGRTEIKKSFVVKYNIIMLALMVYAYIHGHVIAIFYIFCLDSGDREDYSNVVMDNNRISYLVLFKRAVGVLLLGRYMSKEFKFVYLLLTFFVLYAGRTLKIGVF